MPNILPMDDLPLLASPLLMDALMSLIKIPREASLAIKDLPAGIPGCPEHQVFLFKESSLEDPRLIARLHQLVGEACKFENDEVKNSWKYFLNIWCIILRGFYKTRRDQPAWIHVSPCRLTFHERSERIGLRAEVSPFGEPEVVVPRGRVGKEPFSLGPIYIPCVDGLIIAAPEGVAEEDLLLVSQNVTKSASNPNYFGFTSAETRFFVMTLDDAKAARDGRAPALERMYDPKTGVFNGRTITLSKTSENRLHIEGLSLTVCPERGEVGDFRLHPFDLSCYYQNSGPTHEILWAALNRSSSNPL